MVLIYKRKTRKTLAAIIAVIFILLIAMPMLFACQKDEDLHTEITTEATTEPQEITTTIPTTTVQNTTEPTTEEITTTTAVHKTTTRPKATTKPATTKKYISETKEATKVTVASLSKKNNKNKCYAEQDVITLAKVMYRECRGVKSTTQKACVAWVACNRVDAGFGSSITSVLTKRGQFAYNYNTPVRKDLYNLAKDVLERWNAEKCGKENVGRVLPRKYLYFYGDGVRNYFRTAHNGGSVWDYSLRSPYSS